MNLSLKTYDIPVVSKYIRRWKYSKYIPFLPAFSGFDNARICCKGANYDLTDTEVDVIMTEENGDNSGAEVNEKDTVTEDKINISEIC